MRCVYCGRFNKFVWENGVVFLKCQNICEARYGEYATARYEFVS